MQTHGLETRSIEPDAGQRNRFLQALREHLGELPELERQLLALHYAGGLSQREIAVETSLSHRTVAFAIEHAVRRLRRRLAESGGAAAAGWVGAAAIDEAFCTGCDVPPSLYPKIMKRIAAAGTGPLKSWSCHATDARPVFRPWREAGKSPRS